MSLSRRDPDHPYSSTMGPISYLMHLLKTNPARSGAGQS